MASILAEKSCTPCRGGIPPLTRDAADEYRRQSPDWALLDHSSRIERTYRLKNFAEAFAFVERAAALAEAEGHHPDICFWLGLCDGVAAHQEDQRPARERFHHGGEARPHCRGSTRLSHSHSGARRNREPGIHIPEAGVHGFRARPFGPSRNAVR